MLNVPEPSPPVPQVSTAPDERSGIAFARMVRAKPTTSSSVSPRNGQAEQERADLCGRRLTVHDHGHGRARLVLAQGLAARDLRQVFLHSLTASNHKDTKEHEAHEGSPFTILLIPPLRTGTLKLMKHPQPQIRQFQVREKLRFMHAIKMLDGLHLDDNEILNEHVEA